MADGFLGRWSQRKQAARTGQSVAEPSSFVASSVALEPAPTRQPVPETEVVPMPTLDDVQALTRDSNFSRFVGRDVNPEVRNAAMKKLFTDPHYNVMDGLDIYIDDYSLPSPLPLATLQKMASAQFLKLVDEPEAAPEAQLPTHSTSSVSLPEQSAADSPKNHHEHIDLRLQPDHAAVGSQPGRSTE